MHQRRRIHLPEGIWHPRAANSAAPVMLTVWGKEAEPHQDLHCCTERVEASRDWRLQTGSEKDPVLQ